MLYSLRLKSMSLQFPEWSQVFPSMQCANHITSFSSMGQYIHLNLISRFLSAPHSVDCQWMRSIGQAYILQLYLCILFHSSSSLFSLLPPPLPPSSLLSLPPSSHSLSLLPGCPVILLLKTLQLLLVFGCNGLERGTT